MAEKAYATLTRDGKTREVTSREEYNHFRYLGWQDATPSGGSRRTAAKESAPERS